ncbi:unnamed protein product [Pieris macdunnoughi]|uniref:Ras-related protein Rab-26 n=1 Tax=Pieris macdunnoughi TaxID=345717 RepID=A0A821MYZ7_9NEOP|nr:unnamed protein product [Pieris macdunnoughi]
MGTDDSMSDDVFEDELRAPTLRTTPSPTGYRDYRPVDSPARAPHDDDIPIHKTILLGDSGVGKTSLLVQFETGKFQPGNFSATVGIGFTPSFIAQCRCPSDAGRGALVGTQELSRIYEQLPKSYGTR